MARLAGLALAPVALLLLGEQLSALSGWQTDVPAMFDATPTTPSAGLRLRSDAPYLAVKSTMNALYGCYLQPASCFPA